MKLIAKIIGTIIAWLLFVLALPFLIVALVAYTVSEVMREVKGTRPGQGGKKEPEKPVSPGPVTNTVAAPINWNKVPCGRTDKSGNA
jgi:hypothetical protein